MSIQRPRTKRRSEGKDDPYLSLIEALWRIEPRLHIMGGFAEDALLHGMSTRHHEDIDVLIRRADLHYYMPLFADLGYSNYDLFLSDPAGRPTVLNCKRDDTALELCIADQTSDGQLYFDVYGEPEDTPYRIFLPEDAVQCTPSIIDGIPIQTVTPLTLYHLRAALGVTQSFGGFRPKDVIAQKALWERFFAGKTAAELSPRVERLP